MAAPKCKLCGYNHWASEPHLFKDDPVKPSKPHKPVPTATLPPKPEKPVIEPESSLKDGEGSLYGDTREKRNERARKWRENNRESHREYMREYMRRKRDKSI